jgi:hypothetical protein
MRAAARGLQRFSRAAIAAQSKQSAIVRGKRMTRRRGTGSAKVGQCLEQRFPDSALKEQDREACRENERRQNGGRHAFNNIPEKAERGRLTPPVSGSRALHA